MLLLLLALSLGVLKLHHVESAAGFLLKHMMLLFAPLIVGTLALAEILKQSWAPLLATMIFSTLITLVITAAVASLFKESPPAPNQEPPK
jgi:holin-like protein